MNIDPVKRYLSRVKAAQASKATEIRMPTQEAHELSMAIAELMAHALQAQAQAAPTTVKVEMDGGGLGPR